MISDLNGSLGSRHFLFVVNENASHSYFRPPKQKTKIITRYVQRFKTKANEISKLSNLQSRAWIFTRDTAIISNPRNVQGYEMQNLWDKSSSVFGFQLIDRRKQFFLVFCFTRTEQSKNNGGQLSFTYPKISFLLSVYEWQLSNLLRQEFVKIIKLRSYSEA